MTKLIMKTAQTIEIEIDDLRIAGKKIISIFLHEHEMEIDVTTANPGVFAAPRSAEVYEDLIPLLPNLFKTNFGYEIEVGRFMGSFDTLSSYEDGFSIAVDKIVSDKGEVSDRNLFEKNLSLIKETVKKHPELYVSAGSSLRRISVIHGRIYCGDQSIHIDTTLSIEEIEIIIRDFAASAA